MSGFLLAMGRGCALEGGEDGLKRVDNYQSFFRFAEVEMHVLVITLLRRFRLSYHHSPVAIATSFVNKPDRPLKLRFLPRCQGGSYEAAITPEVCGRGRIP